MKFGIRKDRLAIFGGTFDPPHNGHIKLAAEVLSYNAADRIFFVPASHPPHKPCKPISPFKNRIEMLKIAIKGYPKFEISEIERQRGSSKVSYTYDTLEAFSGKFPENEILLLIGSDSLCQLHTWHRAGELVKKWPVIIYPRPGQLPDMKQMCENWPEAIAGKLLQAVLPLPLFDIASTEVRRNIREKKSVEDLLNKEVYEYIKEHELYK